MAVFLLMLCVIGGSAKEFDLNEDYVEHDLTIRELERHHDWTPVGLEVIDFDSATNMDPKSKMVSEDFNVITPFLCQASMDEVSSLPLYLRSEILKLADNAPLNKMSKMIWSEESAKLDDDRGSEVLSNKIMDEELDAIMNDERLFKELSKDLDGAEERSFPDNRVFYSLSIVKRVRALDILKCKLSCEKGLCMMRRTICPEGKCRKIGCDLYCYTKPYCDRWGLADIGADTHENEVCCPYGLKPLLIHHGYGRKFSCRC